MKKLFLTLTALSTLIFFSCASKPEAAGDTENKAPDTELNDKVYDSSEAELSDFYEGTLNINGQDVFVLKIQAIIEKVGKEIAAA